MATNILSNKAYTAQEVVYSSEVSNVSNIDICTVLTAGATGQIKYTIQRKSANSGWRTATDDKGDPLEFRTNGATDNGINVIGLNAYAIRVKIEILSGTGTLNLEYESI